MLKYGITVGLILLGIKFGVTYITSEDFQSFADRQANPAWTCKFNNLLGNFYAMMSHYNQAYALHQRALKRCPKSSSAETAEFKSAVCLEEAGRRAEAIAAYKGYVAKYKGPRARIAQKAIDLLE